MAKKALEGGSNRRKFSVSIRNITFNNNNNNNSYIIIIIMSGFFQEHLKLNALIFSDVYISKCS
jgi:hypothetical protein